MTPAPPPASRLWNGNGFRADARGADAREAEWQSGVPDTSSAVSCELCGRRWLSPEWLAQHLEAAHRPKLPALPRAPRGGATSSAIEAITDRIADGTLKPGDLVRQKDLAEEIGVSGGAVAAAVRQLVAEGHLVYDGTAFKRRALVAQS